MVWVPPLRFGQPAVLAENGVSLELGFAQTIARPDPFSAPLLGPSRRVKRESKKKKTRDSQQSGSEWGGADLPSPTNRSLGVMHAGAPHRDNNFATGR